MRKPTDHAELRFGPFTLDARAHRLLRGDEALHITPKAMQVLHHLARSSGALVTREELFEQHWPGRVVTDDALTRCIREIRAVLADDPQRARYVDTVHRRGYRFVAAVSGADLAADRADPGAILQKAVTVGPEDETPIGREPELKLAMGELSVCLSTNRGSVIEICGEPGIGKSRIAQHIANQARQLGARVLRANAAEERGAPPFWLWIQLLRQLSATVELTTDIVTLLPKLADSEPAHRDRLRVLADTTRFRIRDAVTNALCAAATVQPLLLMLEDLHAAEPDCLLVLSGLASAIRELPVTIVATYRDVGAPTNPALSHAMAEVIRSGASHVRLPLRGLDLDAVNTLLVQRTDAAIAQRLREAALRKSGGNPLFLNELLALPTSVLVNDDPYAQWALDRPESLRQVLERRLAEVSGQCRRVLEVAAVAGNDFSAMLLQHTREFSEGQIDAALKEAHGRRLLTRCAGEIKDWRFSHGLLRETLYDALHPVRRGGLHLTIAQSVEHVSVGQNEPPAAELALHYQHATPSADQAAAVLRHLEHAAKQAFDRYAFDLAAQIFANLRERLLLADPQDQRALARAAIGGAISNESRGQPAASRSLACEAVVHARLSGDPLLFHEAAIARCSVEPAYPPNPELIELIDEALAKLDGTATDGARADLLAQRGFQYFIQGDFDSLQEDARAALAAARKAGEPLPLEQALKTCCYAFANPRQENEWRAAYEERIDLARHSRNVWAEYDARRHRVEHLLQTGARVEMEAEQQRLFRLIERVDTPAMRAAMLRTQAGMAIARGDIAAAWPLARQAVTAGEASTDAGTAHAVAVLQFGALLGLRNQNTQVASQVEDSEIVVSNSLKVAARIYFNCLAARWDPALDLMRDLSADGFVRVPRDVTYGLALGNLAFSAMMLRDTDSAAKLHDLLLPYAGRNLTAMCYYTSGCASHQLGLLRFVLGDLRGAGEYFETALSMNTRMGFELWQLQTAHVFSEMCDRNGTAMRERATTLRRDALELSQRLGVELSAFPSLSHARPLRP